MLANGEEEPCWNNAQPDEIIREFPRGHLQTVQSPLPHDRPQITTYYRDQRAALLFLFIFPASALGQNMTVNLSASMSTFATLPVLPTAPQPTIQLFWEAPEPLLTEGISPWNPLVLSALPGMSLVAEAGSTTLDIAVPLNIVQVGTPGRPVQPMPHANIVLTEESLNFNVPVTQGGGMGCPASLFITATAANTFINDQIASDVQPQEGLWVLESHPPTTQPVVQLVPVRSPVNSAPPPIGAFGESCPANVQTNSPENCLTNPDSVYENIRHWQYIKILVQQHLPQTPDMSAFCCFLM
ncbi:Protein FAM22 [Cricetulus griseus]|uniref:Protein FAM22 n=1 Tax=Cricetulus griseus TaxID=10029 RepID=G3INE3_CRIGR|nr:Protein FAM22 [Cricetulus griseus]